MIRKMLITAIAAAAVLLGNSPALASSPLQLSSDIYVERTKVDGKGRKAVTLEEPKMVLPGDNLVFVVKYRNVSAAKATDFTVTNPMPNAVRFAGSANGQEVVSVDGGNSWGFLSQLRVKRADGVSRAASMADVTHVKWNLKQTLAPGQGGKLVFRGVVK